MNYSIQTIRDQIVSLETEEKQFRGTLSEKKAKVAELTKTNTDVTTARNLILQAAQMTQSNVKTFIEGLATEALKIFDTRDYKFLANFSIRGNRPECELLIQEGEDEPFIPEEENGGSLLDVVSFALRIIFYSMENPRKRPTLILDEPMKWMGAYIVQGGQMLKEISSRLGIQIIMVTHDEELMDVADRVWRVSYEDKKSHVALLSEEEKKEPRKLNRRKQ